MKFNKLAEVVQPNKPKPTTTLPDNMQWAWDPNAADWVAVLKDNSVTTPPLYDPNNQNIVNQNTNYMSNIKSALKLEDLRDINGKTPQEGMWLYYPMIIKEFRGSTPKYLFQVKIRHSRNGEETPYLDGGFVTKGISYVKKGILFDTYEEADKYKREHMSKEEKEYEDMDAWAKTKWQLDRYSSCLAKFLDGPQYSKEIKIEAGLIKKGLVKYAGFDFNRGTKYEITEKGLKVLRTASEKEHNKALNEREKLAYLFGFNTNDISTLDTTGKVIKNAKKWTICEADGTELGEVEADNELDAKVKFGIEHPEYAESLSISAKCVNAQYEQTTEQHLDYPNPSETPHDDVILENHTGWVNTAELEEGYYNPSKHSIEFAKMHEILGRYEMQNKIDGIFDLKDRIVAVGQKENIMNLYYELRDAGVYCIPIGQRTGFDKDEVPNYSLIITPAKKENKSYKK